jgi:ADP-heptose:LPS heptosyltransferase
LFKVPVEEREYDYSMTSFPVDRKEVDKWKEFKKVEKFKIFSWRGSGKMKSLPISVREGIVRELAKDSTIVVTDPEAIPSGKFECDNVHWFCGRDLTEVVELYRDADYVITPDSGSLWIAHITSTPVQCLMGPTQASTRLTHHPLYPSKVKDINLRKNVGCPTPCNEIDHWCDHAVLCFSSASVKDIVSQIKRNEEQMKGISLDQVKESQDIALSVHVMEISSSGMTEKEIEECHRLEAENASEPAFEEVKSKTTRKRKKKVTHGN